VAPKLGKTLGRHPRFKGETVRLVALTPGDPTGRSNRLAQAVERRLRERLLEFDGLRLAADRPQPDCEPPPPIAYLVRLEVAAAGARQGRVHIAVVDLAEAVWVSGISHRWQGALSAAERSALTAPIVHASPGTAGSPIPLEDPAAVAAAMKADLACALPRGLDGALYVATPEPLALSRVGLALQAELMFEPLAAVTPDREQARWLLTLEADDSAADVRELNLTLADAGGGHRQRVASVFVSGSLGGTGGGDVPAVVAAPVPEAMPRPEPPGLLTALEMRPARPEGICDDRKARINSCVEIAFELRERAYLFVVSTRDHAVVEAPCDAAIERVDPGPRRYRIRVPPGAFAVDAADTGPDAGFYVLAARERAVAQRLHDTLASAPGACSRAAGRQGAAWLEELDGVLHRLGDRVSWRAVHVAHDSAGIVAL
jgi:hypothetical protein